VLSSSHGRLRWASEILPSAASDQVLKPPAASPLADLIDQVAFFTHGALAHVEVRRWAGGCDIETHTLADTTRGSVEFVDSRDGQPVALGLALDVDAVAIDVRTPSGLITGRSLTDGHLRGLRTELFRARFAGSATVERLLGLFDAQRLADAFLLALLEEITARRIDPQAAFAALSEEERLPEAVGAALDRDESTEEGDRRARRRDRLVEALREGAVADELANAAEALWEAPNDSWDRWGSRRLAASVGAAFHAAFQEVCPEYDSEDLVVDLEPGARDGFDRVWITEQTIGGGGLLQEALRRIGDRPRRFFDLVVASSQPSLDEMVDSEMQAVVRSVAGGGPIADALEEVREAQTHGARAERFDALLSTLQEEGIFVSHSLISALSARMLRPGSSEHTDTAAAALLEAWDALEEAAGLDIDLRMFAELRGGDSDFEATARLTAPSDNPVRWRVGQITGMLWPRGAAVRTQSLRAPNPFEGLPEPDPMLLRACMPRAVDAIPVEDALAVQDENGPLAISGEVELRASGVDARTLRRALLQAAATPVEAGALLHYPRVDGIRRDRAGYRARLVLDLVGE
jgi:hypothetical protein